MHFWPIIAWVLVFSLAMLGLRPRLLPAPSILDGGLPC